MENQGKVRRYLLNQKTMKKLIFIALITLCGCSAQYRQQRDVKKLDALSLQQPNEFARLSNLINPCFSGKAKSDTVFKTHTDTLISDGTTVTVRLNDTVYVTKTMPQKIINTTHTLTIHDTIADGRAVNYLNTQLKVKSDSLVVKNTLYTKAMHERSIWMYIAIGCILLILIYIIAKVVIFVNGGGIAKAAKNII